MPPQCIRQQAGYRPMVPRRPVIRGHVHHKTHFFHCFANQEPPGTARAQQHRGSPGLAGSSDFLQQKM
jgi:hypothetical protein